jgi:predicted TIM-barrel fold metal-dependent hydrolase
MFITGCSDVVRTQPHQPVNEITIIDTHQHLWNLSQFRLPWLKPGGELTRDFSMDDYKKATE